MSLVFGGLTLTSAPYKALLAGANMGEPQAVVSAVRSLFLDGSVVSGKFSDNRTISFDIEITGATALAATQALDALQYQLDQQTNTLMVTPVTGLPVVFDTFRGQLAEDFSWKGRANGLRRLVTISMPALPFGRTPTTSTLTASATSLVQLNALTATTGLTASGYSHNSSGTLVADSPTVSTISTGGFIAGGWPSPVDTIGAIVDYIGSGQAYYQLAQTIASTSISGRTVVQVGFIDYASDYGYSTVNNAYLTLTSSGGSSTWKIAPTKNWSRSGNVLYPGSLTWDLTQTPDSTTGSGYSAAGVTGWTIKVEYTSTTNNAGISSYWYNLSAYPTGYGTASSVDAGSYTMTPVVGSARCPMDLRVDRGGTNTLKDLLVYQAPIEQDASYQPLLVGTSPYSTPSSAIYNPGTFTVIASIKAASQSGTNSIAASIQQKQGASNVGTAWTSGTVVSTAGDAYIVLGEVTLPLVGTSTANTGVGYTVTISGTNAANVLDIFLLDTRGSLVWTGPTPLASAAKYLFVTSPQPATGVGGAFAGSVSDLSDATYAMSSGRMSGGQMAFSPGSNTLVVCSTQASSDLVVTATYAPRWLTERTS